MGRNAAVKATRFPVPEFTIEGLSVPIEKIQAAVKTVKAKLREDCRCQYFCESCGREHVVKDSDGVEYCEMCADDWSGELCYPCPDSCSHDRYTDAWVRMFMCRKHAKQHRQFCREVYAEEQQ